MLSNLTFSGTTLQGFELSFSPTFVYRIMWGYFYIFYLKSDPKSKSQNAIFFTIF